MSQKKQVQLFDARFSRVYYKHSENLEDWAAAKLPMEISNNSATERSQKYKLIISRLVRSLQFAQRAKDSVSKLVRMTLNRR